MESPIFQQWVKEERAEAEARGKAEGRAEGKAESICKYLQVRFGPDSAGLQQKVRGISSLSGLDRITDGIYTADTLDEAQAVVLRMN